MDFLASKGALREDSVMAKYHVLPLQYLLPEFFIIQILIPVLHRFYYSVLHCLHLVLMDPKGSLPTNVRI